MYRKSLIILVLAIAPFISAAQIDTVAVKSIKGITDKLLEIISVDIGEEPDWENYRNLYLPNASKISLRPSAAPDSQVRTFSTEEFIERVGPLYARDGFYEHSTGLTVNEYNGIATAFQSFYCKNLKGTYEARGINCFQLVYSQDRWWIASSVFVNEDENNKIPMEYLDWTDKIN